MEAKLRKNILTNAAISMVSDKFKDDYEKVLQDDKKRAELYKAIGAQIEECVGVVEKVRRCNIKNWDAFNHLTDATKRKEKIKSSLKMKTFRMTLDDNKKEVEVTRGDKTLQKLKADSPKVTDLQIASIVVECVIFILEMVGVNLPDDEEEVQKAINKAVEDLQKDQSLIDDVNQIEDAYNKGDNNGIAMGIFKLIIDAVGDGAFWDIVGSLLSNMPWYDWVLTSAKIAAFIAALIATGGLAEIAELISILVDATFFMEKLANLQTFRQLMKSE